MSGRQEPGLRFRRTGPRVRGGATLYREIKSLRLLGLQGLQGLGWWLGGGILRQTGGAPKEHHRANVLGKDQTGWELAAFRRQRFL